jgi:pimeloyl-ACP methyl ester carboxylesterase
MFYGSKLDVLESSVREKHTLIVLHGGPGLVDHTLYVSFWSIFSNIAQVIFIDQRGSGRSNIKEHPYANLAQQGKDVYLFCEQLGIEKPILAGISWVEWLQCLMPRNFPIIPVR